MSRVSVVVPSYDNPDTIGATLASVAAQTRPADEILVVDDGSPTPVATTIGEAFPQVRVIRLAENRGVQAARNAGYAAATGDRLLFLDADDLLAPAFLAVAGAALDAHPGAGACFCDFHRTPSETAEAALAQSGAPRPRTPPPVEPLPRGAGLRHYLDHTGGFLPSFTLFRKSALDGLAGAPDLFFARTPLAANEDFHLFCRFLAVSDAVFAPELLGVYRLREGSASKNETRLWADRERAIDSLLGLGPEAGFTAAERARLAEMRDAAARRHARLLDAAGDADGARRVLRASLARRPSAKTLAQMAALAAGRRWRRLTGRPAR